MVLRVGEGVAENSWENLSEILPVALLEEGLRMHEGPPKRFMVSDFPCSRGPIAVHLGWTEHRGGEDMVLQNHRERTRKGLETRLLFAGPTP